MKLAVEKIRVGRRHRVDLGDLDGLRDSIGEIGLLHPIVVTRENRLVAGRRRLEACRSLGISSVPVVVVDLKSPLTGELHENTQRKDFTAREIVAIHEAMGPPVARAGRENSRGGGAGGGKAAGPGGGKGWRGAGGAGSAAAPAGRRGGGQGRTRDVISDYVGVSHGTLDKLVEIGKKAKTDEKYGRLLDSIDDGRSRNTVSSVYSRLKKEEAYEEEARRARRARVPAAKGASLHHGPFQDVEPPGKIRLIITDPPYDRKNVAVYAELGEYAMEHLEDGGSLVCLAGNYMLPDAIRMLSGAGLEYQWLFAVIHTGGRARMWRNGVSVGYKPMLWYTRGRYRGKVTVSDVVRSEPGKKEEHPWAQSGVEAAYYIGRLSRAGQLVADPFMGSGAFGAAAVSLGRKFLGCETDSAAFAVARRNVSLAGGKG